MQVNPNQRTFKAPGIEHLKLEYDNPLSKFAFKFNVRRFVMAYGVLIYNYLGPGEEKRYITTWGMAFLLNTFGLGKAVRVETS